MNFKIHQSLTEHLIISSRAIFWETNTFSTIFMLSESNHLFLVAFIRIIFHQLRSLLRSHACMHAVLHHPPIELLYSMQSSTIHLKLLYSMQSSTIHLEVLYSMQSSTIRLELLYSIIFVLQLGDNVPVPIGKHSFYSLITLAADLLEDKSGACVHFINVTGWILLVLVGGCHDHLQHPENGRSSSIHSVMKLCTTNRLFLPAAFGL